jgi:Spy/CpxP family protein refolding chaperone
LDIQNIVEDLKSEKERLDRAIAALEDPDSRSAPSKSRKPTKPATSVGMRPASANKTGRALTPEGRKRLSESMKKRWAERRKKGQAK